MMLVPVKLGFTEKQWQNRMTKLICDSVEALLQHADSTLRGQLLEEFRHLYIEDPRTALHIPWKSVIDTVWPTMEMAADNVATVSLNITCPRGFLWIFDFNFISQAVKQCIRHIAPRQSDSERTRTRIIAALVRGTGN